AGSRPIRARTAVRSTGRRAGDARRLTRPRAANGGRPGPGWPGTAVARMAPPEQRRDKGGGVWGGGKRPSPRPQAGGQDGRRTVQDAPLRSEATTTLPEERGP